MPLDYLQRPFNVELDVNPDGGASGTTAVQYTPDNPNDFNHAIQRAGLAITQSGGVATLITVLTQPLAIGDSVVVIGSSDPAIDGTHPVASAGANQLTFPCAGAVLALANPGVKVAFLRVSAHATLTALTQRSSGAQNSPVMAVRLACTTAGAGQWRLTAIQGYGRG
jgi:hypothetical protein